jgi:hypothetical protein
MGTKAFVWGYQVKSNGLQQSEGADDAVRALPDADQQSRMLRFSTLRSPLIPDASRRQRRVRPNIAPGVGDTF